MRRDRLPLIVGLALIVAGLIGGALTGSSTSGGWWGTTGGMPMGGMMGGMMGRFGANAPSIPGAEEVVVILDEYAFSPNEVKVAAGEEFNLTVENQGTMIHDLTIPDLGLTVAVRPGEGASAGVPAALAPGSYQFLCTVPGHAGAGMTGVLIVEEAARG